MSNQYHFDYCFHPVGQGLFASGAIYGPNHCHPRYRWVYDCGTSSSQELVRQEINALMESNGNGSHLNLVTISHFDRDHISGVSSLVGKFAIDTLLLPYIPLWKRLLIAFEEGLGPTNPMLAFFRNPADFLTRLPGANISQIVFVQPGGQAPPSSTGAPPPSSGDDDQPWQFRLEGEKPESAEEYQFLMTESPRTQVLVLRNGAPINVRGLWEFVPYNDDPEAPISEDFRRSVSAETTRLLSAESRTRNNALRALRRIYDSEFGASSEQRNIISLFLYGGPIYESWKQTELLYPWAAPYLPYLYRPILIPDMEMRLGGAQPGPHTPCSILYTGDSYLDTHDRLERMKAFFGPPRRERIAVLQVMHHGAETNWHKGVAKAIAPQFSVFSSDPGNRKLGHPDAPVLRDFWPYGPIQVDALTGAHFPGELLTG